MTQNSRSSSDVPGRLAIAAGRLNRRIRSAAGELSHGLLSALATVQKVGPIRLAELAKQEFVSAPSATRLVAELEKRGFVSRTVDPHDGRAFLIRVTEEGEREVARARTARAHMVARLLSDLTDEQFASIADALPGLESAIEHDEQVPRR